MLNFTEKGQSIAEYAILIGIVALALAGIKVYMQRGLQAAIKIATDEFGTQDKSSIYTGDYHPLYTKAGHGVMHSSALVSQSEEASTTAVSEGAGQWHKEATHSIKATPDNVEHCYLIGRFEGEE